MLTLSSIAFVSTLSVGLAAWYSAANSKERSSSLSPDSPIVSAQEKTVFEDPQQATKTDRPRTFAEPYCIIIETKFVEVGSTTEELDFDWLVSQFDTIEFSPNPN